MEIGLRISRGIGRDERNSTIERKLDQRGFCLLLDGIAAALREFAEVTIEPEMALLCDVGENLRADPAFAIRMLAGLEGVALRMVSQAASRRNVTVVIRDADIAVAMSRLHDAWFAEPAVEAAR